MCHLTTDIWSNKEITLICFIPDTLILSTYHCCQNSPQGLQMIESFNHFCLSIFRHFKFCEKMYLLFEKLSKQQDIFVPQHGA